MRSARLRPGKSRSRRALAVVALAAPMAAMAAGPAQAATWADEQAMVDSASFRNTFVADPGRGHRWDRGDLVNAHRGYYVDRGHGNILLWAPRTTIDPGGGALWSGCNPLTGPIVDVCPDGSPLAQHAHEPRAGRHADHGARLGRRVHRAGMRQLLSARSRARCRRSRAQKFEDVNGNGSCDSGEPGLGGWTIRLLPARGCSAATTTGAQRRLPFALDANGLAITSENFECARCSRPAGCSSRTPAAIHVRYGCRTTHVLGGNDFGNYRRRHQRRQVRGHGGRRRPRRRRSAPRRLDDRPRRGPVGAPLGRHRPVRGVRVRGPAAGDVRRRRAAAGRLALQLARGRRAHDHRPQRRDRHARVRQLPPADDRGREVRRPRRRPRARPGEPGSPDWTIALPAAGRRTRRRSPTPTAATRSTA